MCLIFLGGFQGDEPDPVYALLKCARKLGTDNIEAHANDCLCDDCPARRAVSSSGGVSPMSPMSPMARLMAADSSSSYNSYSSDREDVLMRGKSKQAEHQEQHQHHHQQQQPSSTMDDHPHILSRHRLSIADYNAMPTPVYSRSSSTRSQTNRSSAVMLTTSQTSPSNLVQLPGSSSTVMAYPPTSSSNFKR